MELLLLVWGVLAWALPPILKVALMLAPLALMPWLAFHVFDLLAFTNDAENPGPSVLDRRRG